MANDDVLIEVRGLKTYFFTDEGVVKAVDGADFTIPKGEMLCVVGESGCGKSITARSILQLIDKPGRIVDGDILYHKAPGEVINIAKLDPAVSKFEEYGNDIAMISRTDVAIVQYIYWEQITEVFVADR